MWCTRWISRQRSVAERLREIMADLVNRSVGVVQRFGGTVDKFTGDGIMAVFGAPVALEDHAVRACLAALGIQQQAVQLAAEIQRTRPNGFQSAGRPQFGRGHRR